jgi:hypothetical protein
VYAYDCTSLTSLKADAAKTVSASGCPALKAGKSRFTKWGKG